MIAISSILKEITNNIIGANINLQNSPFSIFDLINIEPEFITLKSFLISNDLTIWAIVIVLSNQLRCFFKRTKNMIFYRKLLNRVYEICIIDPILKIQWNNQIREIIKNYPITDQKNLGICWSHSIATAIYLASSRIIGRKVDSFITIRQGLLDEFGTQSGQNAEEVMKKVLPKYKLHYDEVSPKKAHIIVNKGRVCVSCFWLTGIQWFNFSKFFNNPENKKSAISAKDINRIPSRKEIQGVKLKDGGHAVVLIESNLNTWTFMNSWGDKWADNGIFRVEKKRF